MHKIYIIFLTLLLFISCSTVKLGYNNADWILPWIVDDYFDLDAKQELFVKQRIEYHLTWHRNTELPRYTAFIEQAILKMEDGVISEEYDWIAEELKRSYIGLVDQMIPDAVDMLLSLNPEQIEYIENKMNKKNRDRENRSEQSEEEKRSERGKKIIKRVEDWVGVLNEDQVIKINQLSQTLPDNSGIYRGDRLRRQQVFLNMLKSKPPKEQFAEQLRVYLTDYNQGRSAELVEKSNNYWKLSKQLMLDIIGILSVQQRRHALEKIQEYRVDFVELASSE